MCAQHMSCVNRHCIDNMYGKVVPGIDNSHREDFFGLIMSTLRAIVILTFNIPTDI